MRGRFLLRATTGAITLADAHAYFRNTDYTISSGAVSFTDRNRIRPTFDIRAGATPLAAVLHGHWKLQGRRTVLVVSGGNIDVNVVARIIERGLVKDGRLVRMEVTVIDRPGVLAALTRIVADVRANIVEIHHNRAFSKSSLGDTVVELVLETRGHDHIVELRRVLETKGYAVRCDA